jgi:hypothetical protein
VQETVNRKVQENNNHQEIKNDKMQELHQKEPTTNFKKLIKDSFNNYLSSCLDGIFEVLFLQLFALKMLHLLHDNV